MTPFLPFAFTLLCALAALLGLGAGSLGAYALGQACHGLFRGVAPLAFRSLLTSVLVLLAASLLACLGPALRAATLDPATALRQE